MEGLAQIIDRGKLVFVGIGHLSQRVGEVAIRLLTRLGQLLVRVARKVATRLAPYVGWLTSVKDVLVDGIGPIVDIVEDIRETVELVHALFALVHDIQAWLRAAREELAILATLPSMLDHLPVMGEVR